MSDHKSDVFTELGHAALEARHNGTPPERAEAARLMLLGKLSSLLPCVVASIKTKFVQVPMAAISQEGKITFLGIDSMGDKIIKEYDIADEALRTIDSTSAKMHVDCLHYPEGSENVAFTMTRPDGKTKIFWGDWKFDAGDETTGKVVDLYCDRDCDVDYCLATYSHGDKQFITQFRKEGNGAVATKFHPEQWTVWKKVDVLGRTTKSQLIILVTLGDQRQCIYLVNNLESDDVWRSVDNYDRILVDSVMERDGEMSFVAYDNDGYIYHDWIADHKQIREGYDRIKNADPPDLAVVCLPSGRILIRERGDDGQLFMRNVITNERIKFEGVKEICEIVEIGYNLAILVEKPDGDRLIHFIDLETDVVLGLIFLNFATSGATNLQRMADWLVLQSKSHVYIVGVDVLKRWLDGESEYPVFTTYPLYTPFDRLVWTEEGILSWHFVNGTFIIIRYLLD